MVSTCEAMNPRLSYEIVQESYAALLTHIDELKKSNETITETITHIDIGGLTVQAAIYQPKNDKSYQILSGGCEA